MPITISENSIDTVSQLIRKEFDNIDFSMEYIYGKATKLIQTAIDFGLQDLAEEMKQDLNK